MADTLGDELREKLIPVFDKLAEQRCCEHGINNSAKANEEALASMQTIINEQRIAASNATEFNRAKR